MPTVDTSPLINSAERLADRLRSLPQSALRKGGAADAGLTLARELSVRAQRLERDGDGPGDPPRVMPDAGVFAVGDQLSVAAQDVSLALAETPAAEAAPVLAECVSLVREAARTI